MQAEEEPPCPLPQLGHLCQHWPWRTKGTGETRLLLSLKNSPPHLANTSWVVTLSHFKALTDVKASVWLSSWLIERSRLWSCCKERAKKSLAERGRGKKLFWYLDTWILRCFDRILQNTESCWSLMEANGAWEAPAATKKCRLLSLPPALAHWGDNNSEKWAQKEKNREIEDAPIHQQRQMICFGSQSYPVLGLWSAYTADQRADQ